jgi:hypothetical protein
MKTGRKRIGRVVLGFVFLGSLLFAYKTGVSHEREVSENLWRSCADARREFALCEEVRREGDASGSAEPNQLGDRNAEGDGTEQAVAPLASWQAAFATLCDAYGRETKRVVALHARYTGMMADDRGYTGQSAFFSWGIPGFSWGRPGADRSGVQWRCEPGKLHVQLARPGLVDAHNWQAAQDNVVAELESRGFDASRDGLAVLVGPDALYLELEAARAGNAALHARLKRIERFEAKAAALSQP